MATAWRISREGDLVAELDVREEGGGVLVATTMGEATKPYRFTSLEAADTFVRDLTASFAYLGCDVVAG